MLLPAMAADNLLSNGDFEEAQTNFLFGAEFTDWSFGGSIAIETADVHSGEKAFRTEEKKNNRSLQQSVNLQTDVTGQEFELTIHYKVLSANAGDLYLNSAWNLNKTQTGTPHDSAKLNQVLPISNGWQELKVKTTKPQDATGFLFSVGVKKGARVIFDDFSFVRTENKEPWYTVMPETIAAARCNIGDSVLMTTLTIRQGNLTEPVYLDLRGTNRNMFRLEKTQVTAAEETVRLWYAPTQVGNHKAMLVTDCSQALSDNKTFVLSGVASDSTLKPEIHIAPTALPQFAAKAGTQKRDSVVVTSLNCVEDIAVSIINDGNESAFTISSSLIPRNMEAKTYITFSPRKAGAYSATIYWSSRNAQKQQLRITGVATEGDSEPVDYATTFVWNMSHPLSLLNEHFDNIEHNKTLKLTGWQNVVTAGTRPWWGYEDRNNDGEHCAKATGYVSQGESDIVDSMWLVTPALDYKNAKNQVFTFRVRGDALTDDMSARLQLYFIDATDVDDVFFQDLEIDMPATKDQSGDWLDFQVNLAGQENIPDVFFMGFKFSGINGAEGAATYLIDDVSWGRDDLPLISVDSPEFYDTAKTNELKTFVLNVKGANLTQNVTMSFTDNHPSKFKMSPNTLPAEGGIVALGFQSDVEGIQDAYLRLRSRGAVDVYVHITVWVKQNTALDNVETDKAQPHFLLENGTLYILTPQGRYTLLGIKNE